jgi:hypothetical protein
MYKEACIHNAIEDLKYIIGEGKIHTNENMIKDKTIRPWMLKF